MLITFIDNEVVAKTCARTFMRFNLEIRSRGYTLDSFATARDKTPGEIRLEDKRAYQRLVKEFKKKTGLSIQLTKKHSYDPSKRVGYMQVKNPYTSIEGEEIQNETFNIPLWITPLKLAPELKRVKATSVIIV